MLPLTERISQISVPILGNSKSMKEKDKRYRIFSLNIIEITYFTIVFQTRIKILECTTLLSKGSSLLSTFTDRTLTWSEWVSFGLAMEYSHFFSNSVQCPNQLSSFSIAVSVEHVLQRAVESQLLRWSQGKAIFVLLPQSCITLMLVLESLLGLQPQNAVSSKL